jgi:predicted cupin superfamily sugar epimerase
MYGRSYTIEIEQKTYVCQADFIIEKYQLQPHPEGGFYTETYRSSGLIPKAALPTNFTGERYFSTAILFLLNENDISALHRLKQDEVWHFYLGGPLRLVMISPDGKFSETMLGQNLASDYAVQAVIPAGYWFGAKPIEGAVFSFTGCTVAPGFDFADFELAKRSEMLSLFPDLEPIIMEFTRQ